MPVATQERSRVQALIRAGVLGAVVIALDQITKHTIASGITVGDHRRVIGSALQFVHVHNNGVAFNFLDGGGALVIVVTVAVMLAVLGYLVARPGRRGLWIPAGLLLGGAIGNLVDRIAQGYVTDFIKLPDWPAFNVADMGITFGVIALLLVLEFGAGRDG